MGVRVPNVLAVEAACDFIITHNARHFAGGPAWHKAGAEVTRNVWSRATAVEGSAVSVWGRFPSFLSLRDPAKKPGHPWVDSPSIGGSVSANPVCLGDHHTGIGKAKPGRRIPDAPPLETPLPWRIIGKLFRRSLGH
jgi:hypothetical protein